MNKLQISKSTIREETFFKLWITTDDIFCTYMCCSAHKPRDSKINSFDCGSCNTRRCFLLKNSPFGVQQTTLSLNINLSKSIEKHILALLKASLKENNSLEEKMIDALHILRNHIEVV